MLVAAWLLLPFQWPVRRTVSMGKNSNAHKNKKILELDLQRERDEDAKRLARRAKNEAKLAALQGYMAVSDEPEDASTTGTGGKLKRFGKIIRKKKLAIPGATKALVGLHKRKGSGIKKKPSALMRKTLKKRAKQQEMDMR